MKKELVEVVFDRRKLSAKKGYGFLEVQIYLGRATRKYVMIGKYAPDEKPDTGKKSFIRYTTVHENPLTFT